jgi:hypothetical protein
VYGLMLEFMPMDRSGKYNYDSDGLLRNMDRFAKDNGIGDVNPLRSILLSKQLGFTEEMIYDKPISPVSAEVAAAQKIALAGIKQAMVENSEVPVVIKYAQIVGDLISKAQTTEQVEILANTPNVFIATNADAADIQAYVKLAEKHPKKFPGALAAIDGMSEEKQRLFTERYALEFFTKNPNAFDKLTKMLKNQ